MKVKDYFFTFPSKPENLSEVVLSDVEVDKSEIVYPCHLLTDQATHTGFLIVDDKRRIVRAGSLNKGDRESLYDYKIALKDHLEKLIEEYRVEVVWIEEVYDKMNKQTTEVLYYIKHMIQDLGEEYSKDGKELKVLGIDHQRWKSLLAKPNTFKKGGNDKEQVRKLVKKYYPLLNIKEEDIIDTLGMMIGLVWNSGDRDIIYQARINKKLPVNVEVRVLGEGESLAELVNGLGVRFRRKLDNGLDEFEYNDRFDEVMNCRYFLNFRDSVCWAEIPHHRNLGQILLRYEIIPKNIKENDRLIVVGSRKK